MNDQKGKNVTGILFAKNIGKAAFIFLLLLLATTFVVSAQPPCDHNVTVKDLCCEDNRTDGWYYYITPAWEWRHETPNTRLFNLTIIGADGGVFDAYCINPQIPIILNDTFNASLYRAEPSCKNNSIAYILNNWTHSCDHCENVSAAQSAIWYFWFMEESVCSLGEPAQYNHTALPNQTGWVSRWIPNCTAHTEACTFINASINKSVPYDISITPTSGSFPAGTPVELEATVYYCDGEDRENVTVIFKADNGIFNESKASTYENETINGKLNATLICNASVNSVTVTAWVKDMKWFKIIEPCDDFQETFGIVNITAKDAQFSFYTHRVPALSLPFTIVLAVLMSVIAITVIGRRNEKEKK